MKIKNIFKRTISLIISAMIVISATSGAIYSFAAVDTSDYDIDTSFLSDDNVAAMGESLVQSVEVSNTLDGGTTYKTQSISSSVITSLTDGKTSTQAQFTNNSVYDSATGFNKGYFHDYLYSDTDKSISNNPASVGTIYGKSDDTGERKFRITLTLKGMANINNILLAHAGSKDSANAGKLTTAYYAVFASDNKADLYNKNKADFYRFYDNKTANKSTQNYKFNQDALYGVKYVGVEIYDPHINWDVNAYVGPTANASNIFYPRIHEFNVYGSLFPDNIAYDDGDFLTESEKGSLTLLSESIEVKSYRGNNLKASSKDKIENLIDEESAGVEFMESSENWAFYQKDGSKFSEGDVRVDFTIGVKDNTAIKKFVLVNSSGTPYLRAKKYEIYAGNDKATLFDSANKVTTVLNPSNNKRQIINVTEPTGISAKYVGFRILDPIDKDTFEYFNKTDGNYAVPRIKQLGVYGDVKKSTFQKLDDATLPSDIGTKLTGTDTEAEVRYYKAGVKSTVTASNANLYDGDGATAYETGGSGVIITEGGSKAIKTYKDGYYYEIEYNLGTYDTLKKVYVAHHVDINDKKLRVQEYEIFASLNKADLWKAENKVATVITDNSRAQVITLNKATTAKYVGMRTIKTVADNCSLDADTGYLRLNDFTPFGEKGGDKCLVLKEDTGTISLPEGNSVVKNMSIKAKTPKTSAASTHTPSLEDSSEYTVFENLTTKFQTGVRVGASFAKFEGGSKTLYRDGTTAYSEITYELNGKSEITDIYVAEHGGNQWKIAYELYISDDAATLFSGTPIYVYNDTSNTRFQHFESIGYTAKYVGMRITAATNTTDISMFDSSYGEGIYYPRLFGFAVYGKRDYSDSAPLEGDNIDVPQGESVVDSISSYYYDGTERKPVALANPGALTDKLLNKDSYGNNTSSPFAYDDNGTTKYYEDRYMDIVLKLKGKIELSDIYIANHITPKYMTQKYALYFGNDEGTLFDEPYYICDNSDDKKIQNYTFTDETARYVGMRIFKAHDDTVALNDSYIRLFEFNVFGTIDPENITYDDGGFLTEGEKGNLKLLSSSITAKSYRGETKIADGKDVSALIDEETLNEVSFMENGAGRDNWAFYKMDGSSYSEGATAINFTITLAPKSIVKKFVLVNSSGTAALRTKKYEIYAGDDKETLYQSGNIVETVVNKTSSKRQVINVIDPMGIKAKYVGFRIIEAFDYDGFGLFNKNDGNNYAVPRIAHLGVYGLEESVLATAKVEKLDDTTLPSDIGTKLADADTSVQVRYYNDNEKIVSAKDCSNIYDGDADTGYDATDTAGVIVTEGESAVVKTYKDGYYYEIEYDLGRYDAIKKVYVAHNRDSSSVGTRIQEYEVYASINKDDLWEEKNKVGYVQTDNTRAQVITFKDAVDARYIGLRTIKTVKDTSTLGAGNGYLRIDEFNVFGEKGEKTYFKLKSDLNEIVLPEGNSVVKRMKGYTKTPTDKEAKSYLPSFDTATPPDYSVLEGLTTANTGTGIHAGNPFAKKVGNNIVIYRDGTTAYTDIVYTLDGVCIVSDIFVAEHSSTRWKIAYNLYVSNDEKTLFDGEPLCVYNDTEETRFQHYVLRGISAKYVGLRITAATNSTDISKYSDYDETVFYPRLFGFGVLGEPDMTLRAPLEGDSLPMPKGETVVDSVSAFYFNGEKRNPVTMANASVLYDGELNNNAMGSTQTSPFAYDDNGTTKYYEDRYMDIVLNLQGNTQLSDVYIAHHPNPSLMTKEYAIYIGDRKDTLFDNSPYYYCDNTDNKRIQHYKFDGQTAKYVGMRIYKAHGSVELVNSYVRLFEFNAFGTNLPTVGDEWSFQKLTTLTSNKLPKGLSFDGLKFLNHKDTTLRAKAYWGSTSEEERYNASMSSDEKIADGDYETQSMLNTKFALYDTSTGKVVDYTKNRQRYQDVMYDLKSEADLSFINIAFPTNSNWAAGDYEVFIGNDKKTLFDGEPYVVVDNYNLRKDYGVEPRMNVIAFDKTDKQKDVARYVGIRIYNPICVDLGYDSATTVTETQNNIYGRIQDFQIYGKYVDKDFNPAKVKQAIKTTNDYDFSKLEKTYGKNLLTYELATPTINGGKSAGVNHTQKLKQILDRKGDELNGTHIDFSDITANSEYIIYFKLSKEWELTQVNGFVFQGIKNKENQAYFASDYEIYVVDEKEDVYTSEPVFHYNADEHPLSMGQIIEFPEGKQPQGTWLAFKMNNPVYSATEAAYMRLSVLYAWGEEAEIRAVPANIAENMPCEINFLNGDARTQVSEKNLTPKELANITDSIAHEKDGVTNYKANLKTYGTIDTKGADRDTLEMVYNLCGDVDIDKIMVSTLNNKTTGFKKMKVYASGLLQGVYDESSLVWTYNVSKNGTIKPTKTFKKPINIRYIRFVFEGTKDEVRLYTIDVIGKDNQKMKTRNLTSSITADNITFDRITLSTGSKSFFQIHSSLIANVVNGSDADYLAFEMGEVGKHGYSMNIDLGDLKTISKLDLSFNYGFEEYWPNKINIYIAEMEAHLFDDREPDYVVTSDNIEGTVKEIAMRPRLARFIRLDFVEFNKLENFKLHDGTYQITSAIADIKLTGTKVKGMQANDKDQRLISFLDKKTNAEISIEKLDDSDIFTNAVDVRFTPEKATNRQMDSLMASNLKIVGKTVYKIEFLDLYGNVIDDLGGRNIQVRFPISKKDLGGKTHVGNASNRSAMSVIDSLEVSDKNGNYVYGTVIKNNDGDTKVALLRLTNSSDPYWTEIGELEDFKDDLPEEEHDIEWYDSIHTTDDRFIVTPLTFTLNAGVEFTAKDISAEKTEDDYYSLLEGRTDGKQVAILYNMSLKESGEVMTLNYTDVAEIQYNMPSYITDNYADFEVYYIDEFGNKTFLWSEVYDNTLTFQTTTMGDIAVVAKSYSDDFGDIGTDDFGDAGTDDFGDIGTDDFGDIGVDDGYTEQEGIDSPVTGESPANALAVISIMVAAAFVVAISSKKKDKKVKE